MNIYNVIILDESGSMSSIYESTLTGVNEVISGIRKNQEDFPDQKHFVSIVTFEGRGIKGVLNKRDRVPVSEVSLFTGKDYRPGGCTPLYDAIGITLSEMEKLVHEEDKVVATVITDGMENSSEEYSGKSIKELVSRLRGKGWIISYIGANQDSVEVARTLNIVNATNWDATPQGMKDMLSKYKKHNSRVSSFIARDIEICDSENMFDSIPPEA